MNNLNYLINELNSSSNENNYIAVVYKHPKCKTYSATKLDIKLPCSNIAESISKCKPFYYCCRCRTKIKNVEFHIRHKHLTKKGTFEFLSDMSRLY